MDQQTILITVIVAIAALIIGLLLGQSIGRNSNSNAIAEKAEKELAEYKTAVSEHFGKTADLVDNLTSSYKDVFEHLGSSAKSLLSEEEVNRHLKSRADKAVTLTYITEQATASNPMEAAQAEIKSEEVVDKATADAEKMAASMTQENPKDSNKADVTTDAETSEHSENTDVAKTTEADEATETVADNTTADSDKAADNQQKSA